VKISDYPDYIKRRIERVLRASKNAKGYVKKYKKAGIEPSLRNFHELPFLTPEEISTNPLEFLTLPLSNVSFVFASSGTTGMPKLTLYSKEDIEETIKYFARLSQFEGVTSNDRVVVYLPMRLWAAGPLTLYGHMYIGASATPVDTAGSKESKRRIIERVKPTVLSSMPSTLLDLYDTQAPFRVRIVETTGEMLTSKVRRRLTTIFGGEVFDAYGLTEAPVGVECSRHNGYHYWEDAIILEVIDPDTGEPLPEGEVGEIVVTNLLRTAMPIIRYRTKDLGYITHEKCSCGYNIPRVWVEGRIEQTIHLPDGVKLPVSMIIEALSGFQMERRDIVIHVKNLGSKTLLELEAEGSERELEEKIEKVLSEELSPDITDLIDTGRLEIKVKIRPPGYLRKVYGGAMTSSKPLLRVFHH